MLETGFRPLAARRQLEYAHRTRTKNRRTDRGKTKVVLAYSGGLDTSVAVKWINETYGMDVVTYTCDLGQGQDIEAIRQKALKTGAIDAVAEDARNLFVDYFVIPVAGGRRALRREVSAGDGPRPAAHRATDGPRGARARRDGRRPRLHRQGK